MPINAVISANMSTVHGEEVESAINRTINIHLMLIFTYGSSNYNSS